MTRNLTDRVVSVVDHQTGNPQPDHISWHTLLTVLSVHADEETAAVWDTAECAVEQDRLAYDSDEQVFWLPGRQSTNGLRLSRSGDNG